MLPQKDLPDQIERTSWRRNVNTTSAPTSKCSRLWFIKSPASDAVCFQIRLRRGLKENQTGSPRVRLPTEVRVHVSPCRRPLFSIVQTASPQRPCLSPIQSVSFFQESDYCTTSALKAGLQHLLPRLDAAGAVGGWGGGGYGPGGGAVKRLLRGLGGIG